MKEIFEPLPLLVAILIGGTVVFLINLSDEESTPFTAFGTGAFVGAAVQVGVRALGVS